MRLAVQTVKRNNHPELNEALLDLESLDDMRGWVGGG
jgi:hypothetical protein